MIIAALIANTAKLGSALLIAYKYFYSTTIKVEETF
jgi:hypothetical protein